MPLNSSQMQRARERFESGYDHLEPSSRAHILRRDSDKYFLLTIQDQWAGYLRACAELMPPERKAPVRVQHIKRWTVYEIVGRAEVQNNGAAIEEGWHLIVYKGEDGKLWARPIAEFYDGRFKVLIASSAPERQKREEGE